MSCWRGFVAWCQTAYRFALAGASFICILIYLVGYIMSETKHYSFARPLHYQSIVTIVLCSVVDIGFTYVTFAYPPALIRKMVVLLLLSSLVSSGGSLSLAGAEWSQCAPSSDNINNVTNVTFVTDPSPEPPKVLPSPQPEVIRSDPSPSPQPSTSPENSSRTLHRSKATMRPFLPQTVLDYSRPSCLLASLQCVILVIYCLVATLQLFTIWAMKRRPPYNPIAEGVTPEASPEPKLPAKPPASMRHQAAVTSSGVTAPNFTYR